MDFAAIFQQINLRYQRPKWVAAILILNQMDVDMIFFVSLKYSSSLSSSESRAKTQLPDSFECFFDPRPSEVSAIPCELFGNTLRALFMKNRDFFYYGEIFLPNTREPLGCLLGFWPFGPKPCGGNNLQYTNGKWPAPLNRRVHYFNHGHTGKIESGLYLSQRKIADSVQDSRY